MFSEFKWPPVSHAARGLWVGEVSASLKRSPPSLSPLAASGHTKPLIQGTTMEKCNVFTGVLFLQSGG